MISNIVKYAGVVALAIIVFVGGSKLLTVNNLSVGTAVDCTSVTCFTTVGVLTSFQDDGTAIFNGAVTFASTITNTGLVTFTGGIKLSSSGTQINGINYGTCQLSGNPVFLGFQTKAMDCGGGTLGTTALTGIVAGDNVSLVMPTTTPTSMNSIIITAVNASSTAGFLTALVTNASSTAVTLPATATTSLQYRAFR